jgi:hypothetical protein
VLMLMACSSVWVTAIALSLELFMGIKIIKGWIGFLFSFFSFFFPGGLLMVLCVKNKTKKQKKVTPHPLCIPFES